MNIEKDGTAGIYDIRFCRPIWVLRSPGILLPGDYFKHPGESLEHIFNVPEFVDRLKIVLTCRSLMSGKGLRSHKAHGYFPAHPVCRKYHDNMLHEKFSW